MSATQADLAEIAGQPHLEPTSREIQRFDQLRELPVSSQVTPVNEQQIWFVDVPLIDG